MVDPGPKNLIHISSFFFLQSRHAQIVHQDQEEMDVFCLVLLNHNVMNKVITRRNNAMDPLDIVGVSTQRLVKKSKEQRNIPEKVISNAVSGIINFND